MLSITKFVNLSPALSENYQSINLINQGINQSTNYDTLIYENSLYRSQLSEKDDQLLSQYQLSVSVLIQVNDNKY